MTPWPGASETVSIRNTLEFEFDPLKSQANRDKYGIDVVQARGDHPLDVRPPLTSGRSAA